LDELPSKEKPVVYIFHGDDPYAIRHHVDDLYRRAGDPVLADLNTTRLDGRQANDEELFSAANSLPFLAERRIIILEHPFARIQSDATRKRFLALLNGLPESTALLLIVDDEFMRKPRGGSDWKSLPMSDTHWMRKWIKGAGKRVHYQLCQLPKVYDMPEWVRKEAQRQGGKFTVEAAKALVSHVANDTQMASLEIEKLLVFVDFKRPIEIEDVEDLTAQGGQADVFAMVDALAAGDARLALTQLHRLLETQDPPSLFGMVVRQFRLLIQARELLDEGRGGQISSEVHVPEFLADKLAAQARRYQIPRLEDLYHQLLLLDEAMKTSQVPPELALDTFVVSLARKE
jgi:DNA polymerase III subunit delta